MNIAIIVSGHIRTFIQNYPSWKENLLSLYNCDIYLELWDGYGAGGHNLQYTPTEDRISAEDIGKIWDLYKPVNFYIENFKNISPYFLDREKKWEEQVPPYVSNICGMWYKIYKGVDKLIKTDYDAVVRLRPDHHFNENLILKTPLPETVYCDTSYSWNDETISDQFFYGDYLSMKKASSLFENFDKIYNDNTYPNAPEYTFYKFLKSLDVNIDLDYYRALKLNRVEGHEYR